MGIESLLCEKCKGKLEIDPKNSKMLKCTSCGTQYSLKLDDVIINNYDADTINAGVVNIVNDESREARVKAAESSLLLGNYDDARSVFSRLTKEHADDYRGWLGLLKVDSKNFTLMPVSRVLFSEMKKNYEHARKMANAKELASFEKKVEVYFSQIEAETKKIKEANSKKKSAAEKSRNIYRSEHAKKEESYQTLLKKYGSDIDNLERSVKPFRIRLIIITVTLFICLSCFFKFIGNDDAFVSVLLSGILIIPLFIKIVTDLKKDSCEKKIIALQKQINSEKATFDKETKTYSYTVDSLNNDISEADRIINNL